MVSVGTVLTLGIIGAVAVGGYALYRNADKIGGAVSRGVETNLTNPIGNYFDSLWQSVNAPIDAAKEAVTNAGAAAKAFDTSVSKTTPQPTAPQQTSRPSTLGRGEIVPVRTTTTRTPAARPTTFQRPTPSAKAGYYYFDVEGGGKYDTQQFLTAEKATSYLSAVKSGRTGALKNITFLGQSALGKSGFETFGRSKNYL